MTLVEDMLTTHPREQVKSDDQLAHAIQSILECAQTCTACADACLGEPHPTKLRACIRLNLDCADVCTATCRVLTRQTDPDAALIRAQLEACITACRACGKECETHGDGMAHCAVCAKACLECADACERLLERYAA